MEELGCATPNMPLWHTDCWELRALGKQMQEGLALSKTGHNISQTSASLVREREECLHHRRLGASVEWSCANTLTKITQITPIFH